MRRDPRVASQAKASPDMRLHDIPDDMPILIAGPTASGKSSLALELAQSRGGVIINADASQVYDCWRVVTARPTRAEEARTPHRLYGHIAWDAPYSAGQWLRDVTPLLSAGERPIIVGGTGLYFMTLTEGMADIPPIPNAIRARADAMSLPAMLAGIDADTVARIDAANRARVQRAWEVLETTGRGLAAWQDETPPPRLPLEQTAAFVIDAPRDWLEPRIVQRFDEMVWQGALDEVAAMAPQYDPSRPAFRAIGVPELMSYILGDATLEQARMRAAIATRQFAKRQRTWFRRRMRDWTSLDPTKN